RRFKGLTDAERDRLQRRLAEPTLWDAFLQLVRSRGLAADTDAAVAASLRVVARDRATHSDVWEIAEALIEHDELAAAWRARHVTMVERMIGSKTGTEDSSAAGYLRPRLPLRYSPPLWELRSEL